MISTQQVVLERSAFCFRLICIVIVVTSFVSNGFSSDANMIRQNYLPLIIESNSFLNTQVSDSTFQDSCINIRIDGDRLTAECQRENGRYKTSSITIRGIHNNNGRLSYLRNSRGESTFQNSCQNVRVQSNRLIARCQKTNGSFVKSAIVIRGIHNDNGRLEYFRD